MKKIAIILLIIMLLSPICVSAEETCTCGWCTAKIEDEKILFEEDFNDMSSLQSNPDFKIYGFAYEYSEAKKVQSLVEIENGQLHVVSGAKFSGGLDPNVPAGHGTRISLFKVPEKNFGYTVVLEFTVTDKIYQRGYSRAGLIVADNRISDMDGRTAGRSKYSSITVNPNWDWFGYIKMYGMVSVNDYDRVICTNDKITMVVGIDPPDRQFKGYVSYCILNHTQNKIYKDEGDYEKYPELEDYVGLYVNASDVYFDKITVYDGLEAEIIVRKKLSNEYEEKNKPETTKPKQTTKIPDTTKAPEITTGTDENNAEEKANKMPYIIIGIALVVVISSVCVVIAKKRKKE